MKAKNIKIHSEMITTSLDAFDLYSLFKDTEEPAFLDSGMHHNHLGDQSFIGLHPIHRFRIKNDECRIDGEVVKGDYFQLLREFCFQYRVMENAKDFVGGAIGYLSYDMGRYLEELPVHAKKIMEIPDCYFNIYEDYILYDHEKEEVHLISLGISEDPVERVQVLKEIIEAGKPVGYVFDQTEQPKFTSLFTKESYEEAVESMRQYIKKGHMYIGNMTHTFTANLEEEVDAYGLYKALRHVNPAPFAAFLPFEGLSVCSSSPERFLKLKDGKIFTRPIKGTRPRSEDLKQDEFYKKELLASEKDKSELLMVVDLERNDLSKVSRPHSVKVTELFQLEAYPTVYHLIGNIEGQLKEDHDAIDLIKATFPGGSITGTPKVRTMEIIEELEPTRRHLYTGSIGYIGFNGDMDLNIVIRTLVMTGHRVHLGVGGGITWESDPEEEYYETLAKAKAPFKSMALKEVER